VADDGSTTGFGISHLSGLPITLTFGIVLSATLIILIVLRVVFGSVSVGVK
jgi:hypothetical protein